MQIFHSYVTIVGDNTFKFIVKAILRGDSTEEKRFWRFVIRLLNGE